MERTHSATLGDRGRLVLPAPLREHQGWEQGTPLLFVETDAGVLLVTRAQARALLRLQLSGPSLVEELLNDRRLVAEAEDAA
ncbi:MAG: cell division protein MraZ [Microbacterium sp.]|nr:MAG: cell division protein MraZ [Microbacterium sp.]